MASTPGGDLRGHIPAYAHNLPPKVSKSSRPTLPSPQPMTPAGCHGSKSGHSSAPSKHLNVVARSGGGPAQRGHKRKRQAGSSLQHGIREKFVQSGQFYLTPWADNLGMTEYDSKEQRWELFTLSVCAITFAHIPPFCPTTHHHALFLRWVCMVLHRDQIAR
jgi:hypothetical protein